MERLTERLRLSRKAGLNEKAQKISQSDKER